jgi:hypothetical protein
MCSGVIFTRMLTSKWLTAGLGAVVALSPAAAMAATAPTQPATATPTPSAHALLSSRELWATIDVCSPSDQPDYVGVRGSMPGDKHSHDRMYMSFRLQVQTSTTQWTDLSSETNPSYVYVGPGGSVRQDGQSFQLVPKTGMPASTLRGVVDYQWRRGKKILQSASRITTAGHKSVSGADPAGYSRTSCVIG